VTAAFTPVEVAALYGFPSGPTGAAQCVAIVELGGSCDQADLETFFGQLGLAVPAVTAVSVDGGRNAPTGDPNGADGEVLLDIEVVRSASPRVTTARVTARATGARTSTSRPRARTCSAAGGTHLQASARRIVAETVWNGGTSAVAPLCAGLIALLGEQAGKPLGFLNPLLYGLPEATFRDVTSGDNAVGGTPGYDADAGWDACTGLGSPDGAALARALLG
jgi:subtilase family serine protease